MFKRRYNRAEHRKFVLAVFKRDKFQCRLCKRKNIKLNAHHIQKWSDYPTLRYEPSNGISLCIGCHKMVKGKEKWYAELFTRLIIGG